MDGAIGRLKATLQIQRLAALTWYFLRGPKVTGFLSAILIAVVGLRLLVPQQSTPISTIAARTSWIASLPSILQGGGDVLYSLGFARIFHSLWFWLPLALLLLNALIAAADYTPGSWRRLRKITPTLNWRHPLADRAESSTRLPEAPDKFLALLEEELRRRGFFIYAAAETGERVLGAARRPWAWLSVTALYLGTILVIIACLVSYHFSQAESLVLRPFERSESRLFGGSFGLTAPENLESGQQLTFIPDKPEQSAGSSLSPVDMKWRLYWPIFFRNTLLWPVAEERVLSVETRDKEGNLVKLIPVQENLPPSDRLNLFIPSPEAPLYFSIPSAGIAVQAIPDSPEPGQTYEVQVKRGSDPAAITTIKAQAGKAVAVEEFSVTFTPNRALRVIVYRDPALIFYLLGAVFIIAGGVVTVWRPALQLWFIVDREDREGQLYGVAEKFGSAKEIEQLLVSLYPQEIAETQ